MTKKKRAPPTLENVLARPWCYFCERNFDDIKVLMDHMRAKHFQCHHCNRRLNTPGGLMVHMSQVHKEEIHTIDNAMPGRESAHDVEVFGMEGIPPEALRSYNHKMTLKFEAEQAEHEEKNGNRASKAGTQSGSNGPPAKKIKLESAADMKARLLAHLKAQKTRDKGPGAAAQTSKTEPTDAPGPSETATDAPADETHNPDVAGTGEQPSTSAAAPVSTPQPPTPITALPTPVGLPMKPAFLKATNVEEEPEQPQQQLANDATGGLQQNAHTAAQPYAPRRSTNAAAPFKAARNAPFALAPPAAMMPGAPLAMGLPQGFPMHASPSGLLVHQAQHAYNGPPHPGAPQPFAHPYGSGFPAHPAQPHAFAHPVQYNNVNNFSSNVYALAPHASNTYATPSHELEAQSGPVQITPVSSTAPQAGSGQDQQQPQPQLQPQQQNAKANMATEQKEEAPFDVKEFIKTRNEKLASGEITVFRSNPPPLGEPYATVRAMNLRAQPNAVIAKDAIVSQYTAEELHLKTEGFVWKDIHNSPEEVEAARRGYGPITHYLKDHVDHGPKVPYILKLKKETSTEEAPTS